MVKKMVEELTNEKKDEDKQAWRLELEFDIVPHNEDDLTMLQYLIADTASAIGQHFGKVLRVRRGWKKIEE